MVYRKWVNRFLTNRKCPVTEPPNKNEVTSLTAHRKLILSDLVGGFNTWKVVPRKYLLSLKGGLETPKDYFTCRRLLVIFPNYPRILMSFREIRRHFHLVPTRLWTSVWSQKTFLNWRKHVSLLGEKCCLSKCNKVSLMEINFAWNM